jgi:hypothetical protein
MGNAFALGLALPDQASHRFQLSQIVGRKVRAGCFRARRFAGDLNDANHFSVQGQNRTVMSF